jgi:hypothetical protein
LQNAQANFNSEIRKRAFNREKRPRRGEHTPKPSHVAILRQLESPALLRGFEFPGASYPHVSPLNDTQRPYLEKG